MLSQLKARDLAPAPIPAETGNEEVATGVNKTKASDAEQQAAARLTCDALCSLANGINGLTKVPTPANSVATVVTPTIAAIPGSIPGQPLGMHGFLYRSAVAPVAVPSAPEPALATSSPTPITTPSSSTTISSSATNTTKTSTTKIKSCASTKQHQLPLFLSKTYHMIDRCDEEIATWSATGDNFVVKNVEKFASAVLPLYFKHSNFSSFARQLNFYGFRKLRSDPILTNDVDPQTACYVRFYHEKFQKNKPELLHSIKRATKSDQQSKDDVDDLKSQVFKLKKCVLDMSTQMERKISEVNYEYNRRISGLTAEYDKLASLVGQLLQHQQHPLHQYIQPSQQQHLSPNHATLPPAHQSHYVMNPPLPPVVETTTTVPNTSASISTSGNTTATSSSSLSSTTTTSTATASQSSVGTPMPSEQQNKMQSLSQAVAMSLMATAAIPGAIMGSTGSTTSPVKATTIPTPTSATKTSGKRAATEMVGSSDSQPPSAIRPKIN